MYAQLLMAVRPEGGRELPDEKIQIIRALMVRRSRTVEARKRLSAETSARLKAGCER